MATPVSHRKRLADFADGLSGGRPAVRLWLFAVLASILLLVHRQSSVEYPGLVRSVDYEVSAPQAGVVSTVSVELFTDVNAGDVVASLDDAILVADLEATASELKALDAELAAAALLSRAGASREQLTTKDDARRFEVDAEDRRLEELGLQVSIETDRIELQRLQRRLDRIRPLFAKGVVSAQEFDDVRLKTEGVRRRIAENEVALSTTREKLGAAEERLRAYRTGAGVSAGASDDALAPLRARVEAQAHRVAGAKARRGGLVLRAPVTGRVRRIVAQTGEAVVPGDPVVVITPRFANEVIAYLPEADLGRVRENTPATVQAGGWSLAAVEAVVGSLAPGVEVLPKRLWRSAGRAEYGVPFLLTLAGAADLRPGERVRVRILTSR